MAKILIQEGSAPDTPSSGYLAVYATTNSEVLVKDDAGMAFKPPYKHGADIASSATIDLDAATGDLVDVTGTTTITAITLSEGKECTVRFTGSLTLTHGASLVLPNNGSNISTAAGDIAVFRGYATNVVRCKTYTRLDGTSLQATTPIIAQNDQTGAYTIVAGDQGDVITASGTWTLSLTAAATLGAGFWCWVINDGTGTITIDPAGSETIRIPGGPQTPTTTITLPYSGSTEGPYNVSGVLLWTDGSNWSILATNETHGVQRFTSDGTWTAPAGVTSIWVTASAGGGGGGGVTCSGGSGSVGFAGGGASGEHVTRSRQTVIPGTAYTITVGAGGTAGLSTGGTGGTGGTTSVGALVSLTGGAGGEGASSTAGGTVQGNGGAATGTGSDGYPGNFEVSSSSTNNRAGRGAGGLFGHESIGPARATDSSTAGTSAEANTGSGGSGAVAHQSGGGSQSKAGGAGGSGIVIIEW